MAHRNRNIHISSHLSQIWDNKLKGFQWRNIQGCW